MDFTAAFSAFHLDVWTRNTARSIQRDPLYVSLISSLFSHPDMQEFQLIPVVSVTCE